jgi:hypothetical protein
VAVLAAVACLGRAAPGLADGGVDGGPPPPPPPPPAPTECQKLDARIAKRLRFLRIRAEERLRYPTDPIFSPFCEAHPADENCQLPGQDQEQQDISRDVSELQQGPNGEPPVTDPVLVPLERRRRELRCVAPNR